MRAIQPILYLGSLCTELAVQIPIHDDTYAELRWQIFDGEGIEVNNGSIGVDNFVEGTEYSVVAARIGVTLI